MTPNKPFFKSAIQTLWADGLYEQAKSMERDAKKAGSNVGSCYTEEILEKFITQHPSMHELKNQVRILEQYNDPVLIQGPTGTGKELLAKALHGSREGKFIAVNCPAISGDLLCSEFFGHVKGAFTGAVSDRIGKFQAAAKGTLFIDEIGDMSHDMQAALLRVLQEKVITRVGANEEIPVDCRIVAATNKDLLNMSEKGEFRLDLLCRLNIFELQTLPLAMRPEDIKLIIEHWESLESIKRFTGPFPYEQIKDRLFNGNVRELWRLYRRWKVLGAI